MDDLEMLKKRVDELEHEVEKMKLDLSHIFERVLFPALPKDRDELARRIYDQKTLDKLRWFRELHASLSHKKHSLYCDMLQGGDSCSCNGE